MADKFLGISYNEMDNALEYTHQIIQSLPDLALSQLLEGYGGDINDVFDSLVSETNRVINMNNYSPVSLTAGIEEVEIGFDESLRKLSLNYFIATVLSNFELGWRNIEWGNMIQLYNKVAFLCQRGSGKSYQFNYAYPLWRLYTYDRPAPFVQDTLDNRNRKEICMITNETRLGKEHIRKITDEIRFNDILKEKLNPKNKADLNKEGVITETGSVLHLRSYGSFIRGLHVGSAVVDDFLDKGSIYSKEQRDKFKEVFYAEIQNIVEPGGNLIVSGTPFHELDLYNDLKNDPTFKVFEYPGIYPNGDILAPDRFTYQDIKDLKISLGSIIFAREILVTPISDSSSLFPWEYLNKAFVGMENVKLVENIESFPFKLEYVITACDFALSAHIGADSSAFITIGIDSNQQMYLLNIFHGKGISASEQISTIVRIDKAFRPNAIIFEDNGFQKVMVELAEARGLTNIEPFTTTAMKKDLYKGLPGLSAAFERGEIKIPYSEGETRNKALTLCTELNSIGFNEDKGKLESIGGHDDLGMALYIGWVNLFSRHVKKFKVSYIEN